MHSKKSNISRIFLSLLALLVILSIAIGVTYSWIEGGITYKISGNVNSVASKTTTYGKVNLTPDSSGKVLDLSKFDYVTDKDKLHFTPVSGDGNTFFFPIGKDSEGNTLYRQSDTNDIGTKYIKYDFDFTTPRKCYIAFNSTPKITLWRNDTKVEDVDTSAFRFMLKNGSTSHIFSTSSEELSSSYVVDEKGTIIKTIIKTFDKFLDGEKGSKQRIFSFDEQISSSQKIEVAIWLDSSVTEEALEDLSGCTIDFDLNLIVNEDKINVKYSAVTESNQGVISVDSFAGGNIKVGSTTYQSPHKVQVVPGTQVGATATAYQDNTNGYYDFMGWFKDSACTESIGTDKTFAANPTEDTTYYAKFVERDKFTITVHSGGNGTVSVKESGATTYTGYKGSSVTLIATPESNRYKLGGWYTSSDFSGTPVHTDTETNYTFTIEGNADYYAQFVSSEKTTTIYFEKRSGFDQYNAYVYQKTSAGTTHFSEEWPGTKMNLDYNSSTGEGTGYYKFTWNTYNDGNFNVIISNNGSATGRYPADGEEGLLGSLGGTYLFTSINTLIEFNPDDMITVNIDTTSNGSGKVSGVKADVSNVTSIKVRSGDQVKLTATASSSSYEFDGWYYGSSKVSSSSSDTLTITGTAGSTITYTPKFKIKTYYVNAYSSCGSSYTENSAGGNIQITYGSTTSSASSHVNATVNHGTNVTFKVNTTNSGYTFKGWYTSNGTQKSTSTTYNVTIAEATTLYARFDKNTTTVYFTNDQNWNSVKCHYWGSTGTQWPGADMSYSYTNGFNQKVYSIELPSGTTGIIFNNGTGEQTVDITGANIVDGRGYYVTNKSNGKWNYGTFIPEQ